MHLRFALPSVLILLAGCNPVVGGKAQGNAANGLTSAPANQVAPTAPAATNQLTEADGDARVDGTGFNATGTIRCVTRAGHGLRDCNAGVARNRDGGAIVTIFSTEGQSREIAFDTRQRVRAVGTGESAATLAFAARRAGRTTIVTVGGERYEIPDIMVAGDPD